MYVSTHSPSVIASSAGQAELLAALVEYDKDMYHVGFPLPLQSYNISYLLGAATVNYESYIYTRDPPAK